MRLGRAVTPILRFIETYPNKDISIIKQPRLLSYKHMKCVFGVLIMLFELLSIRNVFIYKSITI